VDGGLGTVHRLASTVYGLLAMPRFVVLRHESPRGLHWDLLLEAGPVLRAWALPEVPELERQLTCEALPDHRPAYLEYEGPISGGRGSVTRWDEGAYEVQQDCGTVLTAVIRGRKLNGTMALRQLSEEGKWEFQISRLADR